jgi:hypothetical protein
MVKVVYSNGTMTAPASISADLIEQSVPLWAAAADEADAVDLALAVSRSVGPRADEDQADLAVARLLLLAERPQEALTLLARQHITELPAEPERSWPHLLLAACRAAVGDPDAYRWLLSTVGALPTAWQPLYLVGAAADQRGDYTTADQAWTTLVQTHQILTRFTIARFLAGVVARRDRDNGRAAAQTMIDVVEEFLARDPDLHETPEPILTAAARLRQRGDIAGSELLLHTATHRLPGVPALRATAQGAGAQAAMRRFRLHAALRRWMHVPMLALPAAAAVWCDIPPLVLTGLVPVLVMHRIAGATRVPGFTAADSVAWRAGRRLRQGPAARRIDAEQWIVGGLLAAVMLTYAVPFASVFAGVVTGRPAAIARTVPHAALSGVFFAVITVLLTAFGKGLLAIGRRHNWRTEQQTRLQADRYRFSDAGECRCWRSNALLGSYAAAYLDRHLVSVVADAWDNSPFPYAALARCPATGSLWMAATTDPHAALLLLRGSDRPSTVDHGLAPATPGYL